MLRCPGLWWERPRCRHRLKAINGGVARARLSAQKGWVKRARSRVDDGALSRYPERQPSEPASVCAQNARHPALMRA